MTQALNLALLGNNVNTSGQVSLTAGVSGTLPVANGGTGATTLAANNVLLGNGTSALQAVAPSTSGNVLTSNGSTWTSAPVPSTGPSTDYGGVGSYVVAYYGATNTTSNSNRTSVLGNGTTIAGSSLRVSSLATANNVVNGAPFISGLTASQVTNSSSSAFPTTNTTTLSGTWRLMMGGAWCSFLDNGCGGFTYIWFPLLWVRIS